MPTLLHDLRLALRRLRATPGYSLWVLAILGVSVGATAAVFTLLQHTVLRQLSYTSPDRLVVLWEDFSAFGAPRTRVSPATYLDWQRRARTLSDVAAYGQASFDVTSGGQPEEIDAIRATENLLPMLGVQPALGRVFSATEAREGQSVAVISGGMWRHLLGSDPGALGRPLLMNGISYTVIGVMPETFQFPDAQTSAWVPLALTPQQAARRNSHYLHVVGRVAEGRTIADARSEMDTIAGQLAAEFPSTNNRVGIATVPLKEELLAGADRPAIVLLSAAVCILLIAIVNVANLVLVRWAGRRPELAIRVALGATRSRLVAEAAAESVTIGLASGALAIAVARGSVTALAWLVPTGLGRAADVAIDPNVAALTMIVAIATTLLSGALPVTLVTGGMLSRLISMSSSRTIGSGAHRVRQVLLVAEIALALVLVAGAGLMIGTLWKVSHVDTGFEPDHVLTARIGISAAKYQDASARARFFDGVLTAVGAIPGVRAVGLTSDLPYTSRGNTMSVAIENRAPIAGPGQDVLFRLVSAHYLDTIGVHAISGRLLNDDDNEHGVLVVVINEAFVRQYLPGASPIGTRINTGTGTDAPIWMTIVGVIADVRERGADLGAKAAVYVPFAQTRITFFQPSELAIRTAMPPASITAAVQRAVWSVDPEQPIVDVRTLREVVDLDQVTRWRVLTLLGAAALLALALAALGIYSVLSYIVSGQRPELAIRMALGATRSTLVASVMRQTLGPMAGGMAAGLLGATLVTRLLGSLLFEVSPLDPRALAVAAAVLSVAAALAAYVPARRAAQVDPLEALRVR